MDVNREHKGYKRFKRNYMNFFLGAAWILIGGFRYGRDEQSGKFWDALFIAAGLAYLIYGIIVWKRQK